MSAPPQETAPEEKRAASSPVRAFLGADRTPMWFTLLVLFFGAIGTYYLAPHVNAQFESQRLRADFVIRNYADLRTKMEEFQGLYIVTVQRMVGGESIQAEVLRLQELIGRITAQNLSLLPMFSTEGGPRAVAEVGIAMNGMLGVIFANADRPVETDEELARFNAEVTEATTRLSAPLLELYVRIGEVGHLNPTEADAELAP